MMKMSNVLGAALTPQMTLSGSHSMDARFQLKCKCRASKVITYQLVRCSLYRLLAYREDLKGLRIYIHSLLLN